jgi:hypothetical protein
MYPNLNQPVVSQPQATVMVKQPEREWTHP